MTTNQSNESDGTTSGGQFVEFVDPPHEVTEEERNRPRYGRPARNSQRTRTEVPKVETEQESKNA